MSFSNHSKFLLVRNDKIGDLILTTPAIQALRENVPKAFIGILASSYAAPLLENNPAIDQIFKVEETHSLNSFWKLVQTIKEHQFDTSIHFYIDTKTVLAATLAGIPMRIGPFSKAASLLLNQRIVQNRSLAEMHEADYNLDLLRGLGLTPPKLPPKIYLTEEEKKWGEDFVKSMLKEPQKKPILIHPGSKGSAQSWPLEYFLELSQRIAKEKQEVIFTGGEGEKNLLDKARELKNPLIHIIPASSISLRQLAAVISSVKLVISNSTGPLHMAVALNTPTLSFYPQLPIVTSSKRWGPYSQESFHKVLTPQDPNSPMSSISVESALDEIRDSYLSKK